MPSTLSPSPLTTGDLPRRRLDPQSYAARLDRTGWRALGFPCGSRMADFTALDPLALRLLNNAGPAYPRNTLDLERKVVERVGPWFGLTAPRGYIASGSTIAILEGLRCARAHIAERTDAPPVLYCSTGAHPAVTRMAQIMQLETVAVPADPHDALDVVALGSFLDACPRPAIVVATAGTTMTEACDDLPAVRALLAVHRRAYGVPTWCHLDGALSGPPLALTERFAHQVRGADSVNFSTAKFCGTPQVGGVFLTGGEHLDALGEVVAYLGDDDGHRVVTVETSRNGLVAAAMTLVLERSDAELGQVAQWGRALAAAVTQRLAAAGAAPHRFPWGFTVSFPRPPRDVVGRWALATAGDLAHVIVMPGTPPAALAGFCTAMGVPTSDVALVEHAGRLFDGG